MNSPDSWILASSWLDRLIEAVRSPSYNLKVIYLGVTSLGLAAGVCGCFLLFRKRSLLSDTIGHSTLPGVCIAFLLYARWGSGGKSFIALMIGALITGWLSVRAVQWIKNNSKIKEDAALAIPLTVLYGLGVVLLSVVQDSNLNLQGTSGLEYYLFGMVASMIQAEAIMLAIVSLGALTVISLFFKELNCLSFDEDFVASQGLPHRWLDEVLMLTCLTVTIAGLQTVGLLMIMAAFIIPPATARLWTDSMPWTLAIAGFVGATGALIGAIASAVIFRLPAGAAIILASALLFSFSMLFGSRKGWVVRQLKVARLEKRLSENQLLRDLFDRLEAQQKVRLLAGLDFSRDLAQVSLPVHDILKDRGWSQRKERSVARSLSSQNLLKFERGDCVRLTTQGLERAIAVARTHRLTELYLIEHADVAPARVHQYVEKIEEITNPEIASDIHQLFSNELEQALIPAEPHRGGDTS